MFCRNCGSQMEPEAQFCRSCGAKVVRAEERPEPMREPVQNSYAQPNEPVQRTVVQPVYVQTPPPVPAVQESNEMAIVGFVLAFVMPLVGLILSIIGLKKAKAGASHKGLATAGVVISAISVAVYVVVGLIYIIYFVAIFGMIGSVGGSYYGVMLAAIGALI